MALTTRSDLYRRALSLIPGGVNSPVRARKAVGLDEPFFVERGEGAYLWDVDGNRYVDWVLSWGPLLFGHADPDTVEAVREAGYVVVGVVAILDRLAGGADAIVRAAGDAPYEALTTIDDVYPDRPDR